MGMGIRLRAGRAVACCFFLCLHPLLLRGLPGHPAWVPRVPRCLCLHPLLHPFSGMFPVLRLGEFTLQMSLPHAPAGWGSLFPPCSVQAALTPPELGPAELQWMQAAPRQGKCLAEQEGQDASSTGSFGGRCKRRHLKHPRVSQAVPSIALISPCHPKDMVFAAKLVL